jgi:hypothetical protein
MGKPRVRSGQGPQRAAPDQVRCLAGYGNPVRLAAASANLQTSRVCKKRYPRYALLRTCQYLVSARKTPQLP